MPYVSCDRCRMTVYSAARFSSVDVDNLSGRLQPDLLADLRLLVSELVSNSVEHGQPGDGTPIGLQISISNERIRIEVRDGGNGFTPPPSPPVLGAHSGRGLYLVDQIADRWGVAGRHSTSVWVEFDREPLDEQRSARLARPRATQRAANGTTSSIPVSARKSSGSRV